MICSRKIGKDYYVFSGPVEDLLNNNSPDWKYCVAGPCTENEAYQELLQQAFLEGED